MKWLKVLLILLVGVSVYAAGNLLSSNCSAEVVENINTAITEVKALLNNADAKDYASIPQDLNSQLFDACEKGDLPTVQRLIDNSKNGRGNLNINASDEADFTPLMYAAAGGHERIVHLLLQQPGIDVRRTNNGFSALMLACIGGYDKVVDVFIEHPDKLEKTVNQEIPFTNNGKTLRYTALSWACVNKHGSIVNKLRRTSAKDPDNLCGCSGY